MKNFILKLSAMLLVLLTACSGSDTYRGKWKALDAGGNKYEITFAANTFSVADSTGKTTDFKYTQNSVHIQNSAATYGINLDDGRAYQINFPNNKDESVGLIKDGNGAPIYTISKNDYVKYEDIYKLK